MDKPVIPVHPRSAFPGSLWAAPWLAMVLWWTLLGLVSANGDTVEIYRGQEGLYQIIVGVLPEKPVVGAVHFSVTPLEAATSELVADAEVLIIAGNPEGVDTYQALALNTPSSPRYYDANITFEQVGMWTIRIELQSPSLGREVVTIPLDIQEQAITPFSSGGIVFLAVLAILAGGAFYVWRSARRARAASAG